MAWSLSSNIIIKGILTLNDTLVIEPTQMTERELIDYLLAKPCSEDSYPFGPDAQVFKVFGKMFALIGYRNEKLTITLKASPENVTFLSEEFECIERGYHMNKKHWITIAVNNEVSIGMLEDWIDNSYSLITSKLTKTQKMMI
jgi:predicted DNA-binding protein (MmcQ/YjbR family)